MVEVESNIFSLKIDYFQLFLTVNIESIVGFSVSLLLADGVYGSTCYKGKMDLRSLKVSVDFSVDNT